MQGYFHWILQVHCAQEKLFCKKVLIYYYFEIVIIQFIHCSKMSYTADETF